MSTCTGTCCAAFRLPKTLSVLRRDQATIRDGEQIAAMVIPLTPKQARERNEQFGGDGRASGFPWSDRGHHFTCRHWDEETGLCGIYEDRPEMCRNFPYGKGCPMAATCKVRGKK